MDGLHLTHVTGLDFSIKSCKLYVIFYVCYDIILIIPSSQPDAINPPFGSNRVE